MTDLLVTTKWLHKHLNDPNLRVIDIRGHVISASEPPPHYFNHYEDYQKSHIPGALFVDWVKEITDPADPRHAKIAPSERFAGVTTRLGITPDTYVIAYDDANGMFAARLWWALNYYGHHQVSVLNGGWQKWIKEGLPVTAEVPTVAPGTFIPMADESWRRTGEQVLASLNSGKKLMDVRTPDEFAGKSSRAKRSGHIPGAVNVPRTDLLSPDGTLLPPEQLREKFAEQGIDGSTPEVIIYCNGGVSASYGLLALKSAGFDNGTVYDGSWKDWGNDEGKPIE